MVNNNFKKIKCSFYEFIGNESDVIVHLHNTRTVEDASNIIQEGFRLVSNLSYTTDIVNQFSPEEIDYFIVKRKFYGSYTMVIHIGIALSQKYREKLSIAGVKEDKELVFSCTTNDFNEDGLPVHIFHRQFIKGFYDHDEQEAYLSPYFAPHKDIRDFKMTLERMSKNTAGV